MAATCGESAVFEAKSSGLQIRSRDARGFTIVELLVVIAIISGLMLLISPAVWRALKSAQQKAIVVEIDQLSSALNAYKLSFSGCLKNWAAFLIYSLALLVAGIVFLIMVSAVSWMLATFIFPKGSFVTALGPMMIIAILGLPLSSIVGLTIFTSSRDIYYQSA